MFIYRTIGSEGMIRVVIMVKRQPLHSNDTHVQSGFTTPLQVLAKSEVTERYGVTIAHSPAKSIYTYLRSIHIRTMNPTHNMHLISFIKNQV